MKQLLLITFFVLCSCLGFSQDERNRPTFPASDSLNQWGEWQTLTYDKDGIILSCRFKVRKKFMMTCLYSVEIRNDSEKEAKVKFIAGNKGTNYYQGEIGVVKEKIKLKPKEVKEVEYRLPISNNDKQDPESVVCKKCKDLEHCFNFVK